MGESSAKHGPRLDEELKKDTGTRAVEERRWEGPDDSEPGQRPHRDDVAPSSPGAIGEAEAETRSDLARYVEPSAFPAARDDLVESALANHAPAWMVDVLQRLPDETEFTAFEQVWEAVGGRREARR